MGQYKTNITELRDIQGQQDLVLNELDAIEGELDSILPKYEQ
jgi:hypothetical protein